MYIHLELLSVIIPVLSKTPRASESVPFATSILNYCCTVYTCVPFQIRSIQLQVLFNETNVDLSEAMKHLNSASSDSFPHSRSCTVAPQCHPANLLGPGISISTTKSLYSSTAGSNLVTRLLQPPNDLVWRD